MRISITFRQLAATQAIKDYAREKVDRLQRYLRRPGDAQVVLSLERYLQIADVTLKSGPDVYKGREESEDMYASIDRVYDKLERQIRKSKGTQRARKRAAGDERRSQPPLEVGAERKR
jgi:putative sigma-54 modulation protein